MAVWGGLGAVSLVEDRFCGLRAKPEKKIGPEKNLKNVAIFIFVAVPTSLSSSKSEQFWPLVRPIGVVRTEKT